MLGVFELDATSALFLVAAIAYLAFHFYWQPRAEKSRPRGPVGRYHARGPASRRLTRTEKRSYFGGMNTSFTLL